MSAFDQYSGAAGAAADKYGVDRSIFFGLIQSESSWNPTADASLTYPNSHAYGFTQLEPGTAAGLGVNPKDPIQNLDGGAKYLGSLLSQYNGDYTKALAAYHDGPGALGLHGGYEYAATVMKNSKQYDKAASGNVLQNTWANIATAVATGNPVEVAMAITGSLSDAVSGVVSSDTNILDAANNKVDTWVSNLIGSSVKTYIVPIVVGVGAILLIFVSSWGLVKDTPVGDVAKSAAKTGTKLAFL